MYIINQKENKKYLVIWKISEARTWEDEEFLEEEYPLQLKEFLDHKERNRIISRQSSAGYAPGFFHSSRPLKQKYESDMEVVRRETEKLIHNERTMWLSY